MNGYIYPEADRFQSVTIATMERALAVDSEYFEAYYHLAQAYRRAGRDDDDRPLT